MLEAVNLTYRLLNDANPYDLPSAGSLSCSGHSHCPVNGFPERSRLNVGQHETTQANAEITARPRGRAALVKACDWRGRLRGYEALYVVDGATVPSGCTAAANPAHTIAALAERCMDSTLSRDCSNTPAWTGRSGRAERVNDHDTGSISRLVRVG